MRTIVPSLFAVAAISALSLSACERESPTNGITAPSKALPSPAPADSEGPNANAAHYGPHGVAATPPPGPGPAQVPPPPEGEAPALDPKQMGDMAGHACHCGASCKCGHCAGAIPGCHCKAERSDSK